AADVENEAPIGLEDAVHLCSEWPEPLEVRCLVCVSVLLLEMQRVRWGCHDEIHGLGWKGRHRGCRIPAYHRAKERLVSGRRLEKLRRVIRWVWRIKRLERKGDNGRRRSLGAAGAPRVPRSPSCARYGEHRTCDAPFALHRPPHLLSFMARV